MLPNKLFCIFATWFTLLLASPEASYEYEELTQFITAVNSFHPALKYTWEISDDSLSFLDIKV